MGQLELEYHDLLSLFEFLDNGDGEITPLGCVAEANLSKRNFWLSNVRKCQESFSFLRVVKIP